MSLISKMRRQRATFWERSTTTDKYGRYTYAAPEEIRCRWEDVAEEYKDPRSGETKVSRSTVYVDREMKVGDVLKKGAPISSTPADPKTPGTEGAFEIQAFENLPNLKATEFLYTARL